MRTLRINKQTIKYANLIGTMPVYQLDAAGNKLVDYVGDDGTVYYKETGETINVYTDPKEAQINISFSGGEAQSQEFGVDVSAYDATLVYELDKYPICETTLIWYKTLPRYAGEGDNRHVDANTADFKVTAVKPSLNVTKILLGKLVK